MPSRVTMADVAREAGVLLMTVSRVVNNRSQSGHPSPCSGSHRAVGLPAQWHCTRSGHAAHWYPGPGDTRRRQPFFSDVARGAEHVAHAQGQNVFLCNTNEDPQRELAVLQSLEEKRVDGVVLCSSRLDDRELRTVVARHAAVVLVNRRLEPTGEQDEEKNVGVVTLDDVTDGRMVTQHLLDSSHRAIGFLAGPPVSHSGRQRTEGYRAVLADAGLPYNPTWTLHCPADVDGGYRAARDLLTSHPELTALFCYNDLVAVGALQACAGLGCQAPGDIAVVGFDDIPLAALVTPPLTTCRVPRYELGVQAMRLLIDQINGRPGECTDIVLRPELVIRASAP